MQGHSQATKQLLVPSPSQVTKPSPPELRSLEEPPERHEATAGSVTLPLSSAQHTPSPRALQQKVHAQRTPRNVTAVTAGTATPTGAAPPTAGAQGILQSTGLTASPSLPKGISASLRNTLPLPIPSHPQQLLDCPSSAQNVPQSHPQPCPAQSKSLMGNNQELYQEGGSVPVLWLNLSKSQCLSLK